MKTFKPRGLWLLVRPEEVEKHFGTSFIASDDNQFQPNNGEVIDQGDVEDIKQGDNLMFQKSGSIDILVNEEQLLLVHTQQILGTWTNT